MSPLLPTDPADWTAADIARSVRERQVSVPEVTETVLRRLAGIAGLNAVAWCDPDAARRTAAEAQKRLDRGEPAGPLAGVPFTVKDVIATAGVPACAGSRVLSGNVPRYEAPAVTSVRHAGGVLVAKSACPEFAFSITTESTLHGRTISPWGSDLSPGGSSGGEAVLVGCGASALGLGTDFGGSLRWPAQATGILALRPTAGRVPAAGQLPGLGGSTGATEVLANPATLQGRLQVIGPLARTVRDLELALAVLTAPDPRHGYGPPRFASDPLPGALDGRAFGWCAGDDDVPCGADVAGLMEDVAGALRAAGLRDVHLPRLLAGGCARYNRLRDLDVLPEIREAVRGREAQLGAATRALLGRPRVVDAVQLSRAWASALRWRAEFLDQLERVAVAIAPVAPGDATGHDGTLTVAGQRLGPWQLMAYCRAVSLTGLPALSIPCGSSARGLPLSVQVIGHPFGEAEVLAVAGLLERLFGGRRKATRTAATPIDDL